MSEEGTGVVLSKDSKREGLLFSQDSIKASGESVGISQVPDQATNYLAEEATYRIREIIQVCFQDFNFILI